MQFLKPITGLVFLISILAWMPSVVAGELIGNTFVSEKFDPIEITTPGTDWTIRDNEKAGILHIAKLERADKMATIAVSGMWKANDDSEGGVETLKSMRRGVENLGLTIAPIERARLGGRDVLRTEASGKYKGVPLDFVIYIITGNKAYYVYQLGVGNNTQKGSAIEALEKLITTTKVY